MDLRDRKILGLTVRLTNATLGLHYSHCSHCERPWNICKGHDTKWNERNSCFPLCEDCWSELTVEERLPHYVRLWSEWKTDDCRLLAKIVTAVMRGG